MFALQGNWIGLFMLHFLLCSAAAISEEPHVYDFLMLTREWPFSFCNVVSCSNTDLLQLKFNIHGLWAEIADNETNNLNDPAMFCPNVTFNRSELQTLTADLQENWMDLTKPNGSAVKFWSLEFLKHGSCVATDPRYNSTYLYFKAALQLNAQYDLLQMLAKAGIQPGPNLINTSDIRSALRSSFGFDAGVRCINEIGKTFVYELRLCFTKELQPMDCGEKPAPLPPPMQPPQKPPQRPPQQLPAPEPGEENFFLLRWYRASIRQIRMVLGLEQQLIQIHHKLPSSLRSRTPRSVHPLQQPPPDLRKSNGTYACREGEMALLPNSL